MSSLLIRKAIFFEPSETITIIPVTSRTQRLLSNSFFEKLLNEELLNAKKNVSGIAADNIKHLYTQLKLDIRARQRLKNVRWYVKAKAIQELAIMDLQKDVSKIYRYTNNKNELLRMEAQIASVKLYGFEGLRFLDIVSFPISEWEQIKLLQELASVPLENFIGIEKWLLSENKSVVSFALKLARNYHRFELYDAICACLTDKNDDVRTQAIYSLGEIYTEQTSSLLINRFFKEDIYRQKAIIKVLQNIGTDEDIPALLCQLTCENIELKVMIAYALSKISTNGFNSLQQHVLADCYPLKDIINQIKGEIAA